VKGIHLEGLRVLGKPEQFARHYYEHGADELLYMDVVASLYGRNSLLDIVERTAREIFIPLTVGGGLRTVDDIRAALLSGADKVSLNTGAINRPELISEAARRFGSSTIVVAIEAIRQSGGTYEVYTDNGRERTGVDAIEWAGRAVGLGAGELLVTSIDREGTGKGYDQELTQAIADAVPIPVIACGGAGNLDDVSSVVIDGHADAVSLASMLHYECARALQFENEDFTGEGNTQFLRGQQGFSPVRETTLEDLKSHLSASGIDVRPGMDRQ
jgi:cyclase